MTEKEIPQQTIQKDPNYIPKNHDLIYTMDPDDPKAPPTIALVVRKASRDDKIKYVLRMQSKLPEGHELEKKTLRSWFKGDQYLCIEGEEIIFVNPDFILGLAHRNDSESNSE